MSAHGTKLAGMDNLVPLKRAVTEFSERTGDQRYAVSYERVRSHIGHGTAHLGRNMIAVEKSGNRWVTSRGELDRAVAAQQQYQADLDQATRDYEERRTVPPGTTQVSWGSITNHGRWHSVCDSYAAGYAHVKHREYGEAERCNACFGALDVEHGPYEPCDCHSCEDWNAGHPGTYPVLSRACTACGWKEPR